MTAKTLNARQMDLAFLLWMAFESFSETGNKAAYGDAHRIFSEYHKGSPVTTRGSLVISGAVEIQEGHIYYVRPSRIAG